MPFPLPIPCRRSSKRRVLPPRPRIGYNEEVIPTPLSKGRGMFAFLRPAVVAAAVLVIGATLQAADKRPMTVEDLYKFQRVAAPQISPDGKTVVYQVSTVDLARNKSSSALWIAPTDGK